jgi:hypothetical protein
MYIPWFSENIGQFFLAPNLFEYLDEFMHAAPPPTGGGSGGLQSVPIGMIGASATGGGFSGNLPAGAVSEFRRTRVRDGGASLGVPRRLGGMLLRFGT